MLIDSELVPYGVANRIQVNNLNAVFDRLCGRKVDQITIPEAGSGFRASNLVRVYIQAHLRRMLQLTEAAFTEFFDGRGVVAILCARGLYEGLATVADFEKELSGRLVRNDDLESIFMFIKEKAHATKNKDWIQKLGNPNVVAKNVVTMIGKLKLIRANIPDEYDFLSEIAHPNGVGAVGFFADMRNADDVARFDDSGPDVHADMQWIFVAAYFLRNFESVIDAIEAHLPALSTRGAAAAPKNQAPPAEPPAG